MEKNQMEMETLKDGSIRCSLVLDGISAAITVDTMEEAAQQEERLRRAITRTAAGAFREELNDLFA